MNKLIASVAVAALIGTSAIAGGSVVETEVVEPALTGFYLGAGYAYTDTIVDDLFYRGDQVDGTNNGLALIAGYNINDFVAVEGRYTFISEDNFADNYGYTEKVDGEAWSIFVKPQYSVTPEFKVYGLLGYGGVELSDSWDATIDTDGFQYGLGGAYAVTRNVELFADWTKAADYEDNDFMLLNINTDLYTFGANYKF